jgi:hypothetical protein
MPLDRRTEWKVHYAFFGCSGFADTAVAQAQNHHAILVYLRTVKRALETN